MRGIDVKKKIIESGVSLKEVSDKMNVSPQALQNILKASDMKVGTLFRIAKAINKNIYFFIEEYERTVMETTEDAMPFSEFNIHEFINIIIKQQECINELSNTIRINSETINLFLKQREGNEE